MTSAGQVQEWVDICTSTEVSYKWDEIVSRCEWIIPSAVIEKLGRRALSDDCSKSRPSRSRSPKSSPERSYKRNFVQPAVSAVFGGDACKRRWLREIRRARVSIDIAAYCLTERSIIDAIISATSQGVVIARVLLDAMSATEAWMKEAMKKFSQSCVVVATQRGKRGITAAGGEYFGDFHHKFIIRDRLSVTAGSYNPTFRSTVVSHDSIISIIERDVVSQFRTEFDTAWAAGVLVHPGAVPPF